MATVDEPTVVLGTEQSTCENCGSPLAPDQRYCVVCGTRRGPSTLPDAMRASGGPQRPRRGGQPPQQRGGASPAITILAFIGALLLAMGVGILIGRATNSSAKPQLVHVTVNGAGGSGSSTAAPTASGAQTAASQTRSSAATSSAATSAAAPAAAGTGGAGTTKAKATTAKSTSASSSASTSSSAKGNNGIFFGPGS
jgi:hypothetical protein